MYHLHHVSRLWLILGYVFSWINGSLQAQTRLHFLREPERQLYLEPGKINQLDCSFEDDLGDIHHTWYLNDQPINHEFVNILLNGTLRFEVYEDATSSQRDSMKGLYRCCISHDSRTLCSIASNVSFPSIGPPEVMASTTDARIGDVLRFACHVQADPAGIITWFKDDTNIAFDETRLVLLPNDVIHITEVRESDEGSYKCVAENIAGMIVSPSIAVLVSSQLSTEESHASRGAILNQTDSEVLGQVGGEVLLECLVRQAKKVDIYWTNGSTSVPEDRRQILGYGNILLKNLTMNDTGNYTCTSVDKRSKRVKNTSIRLIVQSPPHLPISWSEQSKREGLVLSMECPLSGIPESEFAWYHNGERVESVGRYSSKHSSNLYIYNIGQEDAGMFQCFVWNPLGSVHVTTLVTVIKSVAQSVRDLRITNITSTTAIARWRKLPDFRPKNRSSLMSMPNSRNSTAFVIYYSKLPDGVELSDAFLSSENHWLLKDLHPASNYSVSLRAVTSANMFSRLETVYMKTLEDVPSAAPEIVNITSTSTTVTVQWLPLKEDDRNGVITYQEVCLEQEATGFLKCQPLDPSETNFTFEDLMPGVEYFTYIWAATSVGRGVQSNKYPRITPIGYNCTAPDNVSIQYEIVNTTFIMFMWPAASVTQRELIMGYRLVISIVKTNVRVDFLLLDADAVGYNKTNAGYDTYSVTFYAIGECGQGPASTTLVDMPEQVTVDVRLLSPHNLHMEALSKDKIKVSWSRPTTSHRMESYTIGYNAIGQPEDIITGIEPDHLLPRSDYILQDLQTYTFYRVRVMANYADGTSRSSIYVYASTREDKPGSPPRDVYSYALDAMSINITWKPPLVPNGLIISYTISYLSSYDVTEWKEVEKHVDDDSPSTLWLVLKNLQPNTRYTFKLGAATKVGKGPETILHNVSTKNAGTGTVSANNLADLRKGILTGVCLALLCIVVCVSLLVYHLRRSICRQQDWQCRSVATRTSTPGHYKNCHHRSRKWQEPPDQDCSLSVLQTEFEMEHLMVRERPSPSPERLMIQVHHVDSNIPARGATSENPAEEPFLVHREPSPTEHHHTSQEIPPEEELPVIPQKDPKDLEHLPQCEHCTSRDRSTSDIILEKLSGSGNARRGDISPNVSGSHSSAMAHQDFNEKNLPASSHDKCPHCQSHKSYLYSNETLPWSATSEDCRNMGRTLSLPSHCSGKSQEDPYDCGACQAEGEEKGELEDTPSGCKLHVELHFDSQGCPQMDDQQSDSSGSDRDSGLDGESIEEVTGAQDTSPNFLERVLEELSVAE
ncbi:Protogenin [Holothuria leucospilota]|uniref:Protogenin n=1 Tax=Holothuria leucospilota TaxID=206669 RepID=A0A9Q1H7P9_HOLLE|nr:Protogenin [Holothuria leucospilota]